MSEIFLAGTQMVLIVELKELSSYSAVLLVDVSYSGRERWTMLCIQEFLDDMEEHYLLVSSHKSLGL